MSNNINQIIDFCEGNLSEKRRGIFKKRLRKDQDLCKDFIAYIRTNKYIEAQINLEDVESDPALQEMDTLAKELVETYNNEREQFSDLYNYVGELIDSTEANSNINKEIRDIEKEIKAYGVDDIVNSWVNEWENNKAAGEDNPEYHEHAVNTDQIRSDRFRRKKFYIIATTTAAVIALLLTINTLIPKSPESIYKSFYKPMEPGLLGSRNIPDEGDNNFLKGIEYYEDGDYTSALNMLNMAAKKDNQNSEIVFYVGLSQIGINEINQAKESFKVVEKKSGDFIKEASWYLGLCYLSSGETTEAKSYLEPLARKQGYYQNRAKKILRRLK